MPRLAIGLAVGVLSAAAAGCATTTRAQVPVERPVLEVPPAPPRVIEAAPPPEVIAIEPVQDLPPPPPEAKPPRRNSPREVTAKETQKPEAKPDPAQPTEPAAPAQNVQPAPQLRTPATADAATAEREIREAVLRVRTLLNGIDFQQLNAERRKEYQNAKDLADQAEAAIKSGSFELAKGIAANAEKLAKELQR